MSESATKSIANRRIRVSSSTEQAYSDAAQLILDDANRAIAQRGKFTIALSGGSTPKRLFELMASDAWKNKIPWNNIEFFWGDERYVPPTDASSNYRMTREAMLDKVPISGVNVHRVMTEKPDQEAAAEYEKTIRQIVPAGANGVPEFDLILLGLGTNGHMASLFPHQPALHEHRKLVVAEYIDEVKMTRVTMTLPLINSAKSVVFVTLGPDKASVLREVIVGPRDPERLPAQLIQPSPGQLTWLIDAPASAELPKEILNS